MGKISFSDGLAIGGVIIAILLVVLDKADKLRGPMLYFLLAVAACMALPLVFSLPWITTSPAGAPMYMRRLAMFFTVGLAYALISVWISSTEDNRSQVLNEPRKIVAAAPEASGSTSINTHANESHHGPPKKASSTAPPSMTVIQEILIPPAESTNNPSVQLFITMKAAFDDPVFKIKCDGACSYTQTQAMALPMRAEAVPHIADDTIIEVRLIVPGRLEIGNEIMIEIGSRTEKPISVLSVNGYPVTEPITNRPKASPPPALPPPVPEIIANFIQGTSPGLLLINNFKAVIKDPVCNYGMWNLSKTPPLMIPTWDVKNPGTFIKQGTGLILATADTPQAKPYIEKGDKIFSLLNIDCPDCKSARLYYLYFVYGEPSNSWFAPVPEGGRSNVLLVNNMMEQSGWNVDTFMTKVPHEPIRSLELPDGIIR